MSVSLCGTSGYIFVRRAVRVQSLLIVVFTDSITSVISSVKVTAAEQKCLHYLQKLNGPNCFHIIATLEPFFQITAKKQWFNEI